MSKIEHMTEEELTHALCYAGFILLAFELVKSLIINPIKAFYTNTTFGVGLPFKSYEEDVISRHKDQFEACLLYLRDFMKAIDSQDLLAIHMLRKHRNELSHELPSKLHDLRIQYYVSLLNKVNTALFKLSNYRVYMEIGSDPEFQNRGIDWNEIVGPEYLLFKNILNRVKALQWDIKNA